MLGLSSLGRDAIEDGIEEVFVVGIDVVGGVKWGLGRGRSKRAVDGDGRVIRVRAKVVAAWTAGGSGGGDTAVVAPERLVCGGVGVAGGGRGGGDGGIRRHSSSSGMVGFRGSALHSCTSQL